MAGYDPQKARGRHEIPDDEPAPVDGLLGPVPEADGNGPTLAHDAGRPMVRQVLPVPPVAPEPATAVRVEPVDEPTSEEPTAGEPIADATPDPVIPASGDVDPAPPTAVSRPTPVSSAAPASSSPALPASSSSPSSRVRIAAIVAAVVALVVLVLWRRRRH